MREAILILEAYRAPPGTQEFEPKVTCGFVDKEVTEGDDKWMDNLPFKIEKPGGATFRTMKEKLYYENIAYQKIIDLELAIMNKRV